MMETYDISIITLMFLLAAFAIEVAWVMNA
jgi:hypothetical protein